MSALCQKRTHALQQKQHLYPITSSARCWSSASTSLANHVKSSPCALVRLVDQPHGARAVVHADRRRRASPPVVERIAQCGENGRGDVSAREGLVAVNGGELHDPVLHCEDRVAASDLPLTVSAVTGGSHCRPRRYRECRSPSGGLPKRSPQPGAHARAGSVGRQSPAPPRRSGGGTCPTRAGPGSGGSRRRPRRDRASRRNPTLGSALAPAG